MKNPLTIQETWVQSLVQEDPLEEGIGTHMSILAGQKSLVGCSHKESDKTETT